MNNEFILGKSYLCTSGTIAAFVEGVIYETEKRWGQDFVNLVQPKDHVCNYSDFGWNNFSRHTFEEVNDEDNTIQVGDVVEYKVNDPVFKYEVIFIHECVAWLSHNGYNIHRDVSKLSKVKDIRTIECAGGAVRITGEFVERKESRTKVRTKEACHGCYVHWGAEVPQTPSQPH